LKNDLFKTGITGEKQLNKKIQILLLLGVLLMILGTFLEITINPFFWGTGTVTALFVVLLFRIDPLNPGGKD
jgi:hypothetical protein